MQTAEKKPKPKQEGKGQARNLSMFELIDE